eukprot:TRINITY_DN19931_c1_g1_i1.p1 TRINITY_DN19931_c1_g1~~TRINITY_DN19931_c1_g1_i1.p1  ORF type:complete len:124 (-),score=17.12 TRINITY_DN19931_c1_g1_i1:89-460(-)
MERKTIVFVLANLIIVAGLFQPVVSVGGFTQEEVQEGLNSPKIKNLVSFGFQEIQKRDKSFGQIGLVPVKLLSYSTQVVGGLNHKFSLECEARNKKKYILQSIIYERSWQNFRQLSSHTLRAK